MSIRITQNKANTTYKQDQRGSGVYDTSSGAQDRGRAVGDRLVNTPVLVRRARARQRHIVDRAAGPGRVDAAEREHAIGVRVRRRWSIVDADLVARDRALREQVVGDSRDLRVGAAEGAFGEVDGADA